MKFLLSLCCSFYVAFATIPVTDLHEQYQFDDYLQHFPKSYVKDTEEYHKRKAIFETRLRDIIQHNLDEGHSWKRGLNEFSDLSEQEFVERFSKKNANPVYADLVEEDENEEHEDQAETGSLDSYFKGLPHKVDWHAHGITTGVHAQCGGSCWAHTTAEVLESYLAKEYGLKHSEIPNLSVQEVMACTPNPQHCGGEGGCKGATVELGMQWVKKHGLSLESQYPLGKNSFAAQKCPCTNKCTNLLASKNRLKVKVGGYRRLRKNKLRPLLKAVTKGPVAISVGCDGWQDYSGGVLACKKNPNTIIGHAVVLVGYGTDQKTGHRFWKVRNSWGDSWGENGYVRLLMRENEHSFCGKNTKPHEGTGCDGGPKVVPVCGTCGILFDSVVPKDVHLVDAHGSRVSREMVKKHLNLHKDLFVEADRAIQHVLDHPGALLEDDQEEENEPESVPQEINFFQEPEEEEEEEPETPFSNEHYNVNAAIEEHADESDADEDTY